MQAPPPKAVPLPMLYLPLASRARAVGTGRAGGCRRGAARAPGDEERTAGVSEPSK